MKRTDATLQLFGLSQLFLISLFTAAALLLNAANAQDATNGEKLFKKCASCHMVGTGAKNKVGPILNGVVGRPAGKVAGYKYTKALLASGITWDEGQLAAYIRDSKGTVKGTRMIFSALKKDGEIADVIAYLKRFDTSGNLKR